MATTTPKLGLIKPDFVDVVDVSELNDNMDVLDDALTDSSTLDDLSGVDLTSPVAGEKLVFDGTNWVNLEGYVFVETVYFTSNGTFTKADYPWLRAIRVKCQGAGGGGSGVAASTAGAGGGGAGGGYAESFITDIASLSSSETVTIGAGGDGGTGLVVATSGGGTTFGSLVTGTGGTGSAAGGLSGAGVTGTGDVVHASQAGGAGTLTLGAPGGAGGSSHLGGGGRGGRLFNGSSANAVGNNGNIYGGGGGGASNTGIDANNRAGGDGANGIVIVELFA